MHVWFDQRNGLEDDGKYHCLGQYFRSERTAMHQHSVAANRRPIRCPNRETGGIRQVEQNGRNPDTPKGKQQTIVAIQAKAIPKATRSDFVLHHERLASNREMFISHMQSRTRKHEAPPYVVVRSNSSPAWSVCPSIHHGVEETKVIQIEKEEEEEGEGYHRGKHR